MTDDVEATILSGMLEFYSSKSNSHASFVVAGVFGIYSILNFMNRAQFWWIFLSYCALLFIDAYAFFNFGFYGAKADILRGKLEKISDKPLGVSDEALREAGFFAWHFDRFRKKVGGKKQWVLLGTLWFCAVIVPFIVICYRTWSN